RAIDSVYHHGHRPAVRGGARQAGGKEAGDRAADGGVVIQPTASKSDLLLACQRPFAVDAPPRESTEPMNYGSAFHEGMHERSKILLKGPATINLDVDAIAAKWGVKEAPALATHIDLAWSALIRWIGGEN